MRVSSILQTNIILICKVPGICNCLKTTVIPCQLLTVDDSVLWLITPTSGWDLLLNVSKGSNGFAEVLWLMKNRFLWLTWRQDFHAAAMKCYVKCLLFMSFSYSIHQLCLVYSMLFGNLYIYFDWNGRTEISGRVKPDRSSVNMFEPDPVYVSSVIESPSLREQQDKHISVPAGRLLGWDAQFPGVEKEPPWRGDALWGGRTVPALSPDDVNEYSLDN